MSEETTEFEALGGTLRRLWHNVRTESTSGVYTTDVSKH